MITPLLRTAFYPLVERHQATRRWRTLSWTLLALAAGFALLAVLGFAQWWAFLFVLLAVVLGRSILARRTASEEPDYTELARRIEARHPELHALLLTAVEQTPNAQTRKLTFLQQKVIADAVAASRRLDWIAAVPATHLWRERLFTAASAVVLGFALFGFDERQDASARGKAALATTKEAVTINPGDTEVERGSGLVVLANFHREVPGEAILVIQPKNQPAQRIALVKNLDDPVFGGGLPEVDAELTYRVEYAGTATRDFTVKVFEHPRLDRADATLHFPEYTKLPEKAVPDTRRVSAVEGTKLDIAFQLNKPVKSATLVAKDGTKVPLEVTPDQSAVKLNSFAVSASQSYELKLEDADGRANKIPAQFIVDALPNRRPELKFQTPKGDQRVSPLEEVAFRAEAWDDFGLAHYGLTVNVAGRGQKEVELGRETRADEKREVTHLMKLEEVGVKPDELVSWFLWAEDVGPNGQARRTETDMYFAEVRPFEEIFRRDDGEGEAAAGGAGGGEETTKLAELQKQIISATWNLKRAEDANVGPSKPSDKYLKDEPVIRDSQAAALQQANALAAKIEDLKLKAFAEIATKEMQTALDHLTKADKTTAPLPDALSAEQAAYNALLKLAAHEFRVRKGKGKGQGGGKQQQQLDELEMKDEKQRYETKNEAESPQNEQQREQLAILNRLKELAQRQQDINERLKELQTALQAAKTEPEKKEIKRQLKRLREEEQQLLADLDETKQKMEQSSQQSQLANERQQLDKTRTEAQKAADSMEKGETSQALASGTRAQRDLQQMRDDFRKKTSGQFKEEMREMRADARDLAEKQQEIAEKLKPEPGKQERRTLDGSSPREQLAEQFTNQQENLGKITERMKEVSEQAEGAEPLLAKELYDTLRKTAQAGTGETLEKSQILAQRGYTPQAQKFEEKARQEIEELKSGVERAAESVLGDEAEALRQARTELDTLKQQIEQEIARARPDLADAGSQGGEQKSPSGEGASQQGQQSGEQAGKEPGARGEEGEGQKPGDSSAPQKPAEAGQQPGEQKGAAGGQQPGDKKGTELGKGQHGEGQQPGPEGQPEGGQTAQQSSSPGQGKSKGQGEGEAGETAQGQSQGEGQGRGNGQGGAGQGRQQSAQASPVPGQGEGQGQGDGNGINAPQDGQPGAPNTQRGAQRLSQASSSPQQRGGIRSGSENGGGMWGGGAEGEQAGPLTGEKFTEWSDRLRNVEEMVDDPALRTEVARVREFAKGVRVEFKRHSVAPNWDIVKSKISTPLAELRNRLTEELARRESKENLVPIDRDPVPTKYAERVRRYYEELGRSR
jgi:hypothetical protein